MYACFLCSSVAEGENCGVFEGGGGGGGGGGSGGAVPSLGKRTGRHLTNPHLKRARWLRGNNEGGKVYGSSYSSFARR